MNQCLYCYIPITNRQRNSLYCSEMCGNRYRKREQNPKSTKGCRYCKNADDKGYCCNEHRRIYQGIMRDVEITKLKPKRKPTEVQLKQYQKIENFLNRPL